MTQNEKNWLQISSLTRLDKDTYFRIQFEEGIRYLEETVGCDQFGLNLLSGSDLFWNWWINHWIRRDREFRGFGLPEYLEHHGNLEVYPHRMILEASYSKMIKEVRNGEVEH